MRVLYLLSLSACGGAAGPLGALLALGLAALARSGRERA